MIILPLLNPYFSISLLVFETCFKATMMLKVGGRKEAAE